MLIVNEFEESLGIRFSFKDAKTINLKEHTQKADILISACGKAEFIKKEHIKKNCIIIDIGINAITDKTEKTLGLFHQ